MNLSDVKVRDCELSVRTIAGIVRLLGADVTLAVVATYKDEYLRSSAGLRVRDVKELRECIDNVKAHVEVVTDKERAEDYLTGWREAAIAWTVCASIHREYAKGKDPFYRTRQADFTRDEKLARDKAYGT